MKVSASRSCHSLPVLAVSSRRLTSCSNWARGTGSALGNFICVHSSGKAIISRLCPSLLNVRAQLWHVVVGVCLPCWMLSHLFLCFCCLLCSLCLMLCLQPNPESLVLTLSKEKEKLFLLGWGLHWRVYKSESNLISTAGSLVVNYPYDDDEQGMAIYSKSPDDAVFQQLALSYSKVEI